MTGGVPTKVVATVFALAAFAVAVIAGLAAGNTSSRILGVALASMIACHVVGLVLGAIAEKVVTDYLQSCRTGTAPRDPARSNPVQSEKIPVPTAA